MLSPLGEVPEHEQELRDRGIAQHRHSSNAANARGYTIYPKPFNGEDFLAFKSMYENLIAANEWTKATATGHLIYCFSQGPAQVILASRPGHQWTYEELMTEGLQMFGQTISEAQMRMQLRKVQRKPDESLPKLVQRIMAVSKRAVTISENARSAAECETFIEAIADNRPLYFHVNKYKGPFMRISEILTLAMNYSNEEGASDEWVNELVQKALKQQGIEVKPTTDSSSTVPTSGKPEDGKTASVNAISFNEKNKAKDWQEGYQQITKRLNEDLNLKQQENVDRKIQNQKFLDTLEKLQGNLKEQSDNIRKLNEHQERHFNQWSGNSSGYNNNQNSNNRGWYPTPRGRGGRGNFRGGNGKGRGWKPGRQNQQNYSSRFNWFRMDADGNCTDVLDDEGNIDLEYYGGCEEGQEQSAPAAPTNTAPAATVATTKSE